MIKLKNKFKETIHLFGIVKGTFIEKQNLI